MVVLDPEVEIVIREEGQLGKWPRRLLHVDTLTSYEWRPGNIYNGVQEPEYNTISHTWGRFELKAGEMPEIDAIRIKGIDWDVPRIRPDHFTVEESENVLRNVVTPTKSVENTYGKITQYHHQIGSVRGRDGELLYQRMQN